MNMNKKNLGENLKFPILEVFIYTFEAYRNYLKYGPNFFFTSRQLVCKICCTHSISKEQCKRAVFWDFL